MRRVPRPKLLCAPILGIAFLLDVRQFFSVAEYQPRRIINQWRTYLIRNKPVWSAFSGILQSSYFDEQVLSSLPGGLVGRRLYGFSIDSLIIKHIRILLHLSDTQPCFAGRILKLLNRHICIGIMFCSHRLLLHRGWWLLQILTFMQNLWRFHQQSLLLFILLRRTANFTPRIIFWFTLTKSLAHVVDEYLLPPLAFIFIIISAFIQLYVACSVTATLRSFAGGPGCPAHRSQTRRI